MSEVIRAPWKSILMARLKSGSRQVSFFVADFSGGEHNSTNFGGINFFTRGYLKSSLAGISGRNIANCLV